jgi:histidine triad (HIT) family protein
MQECIFCRIVERSIPATIVYEDEYLLAFKDIHPKAPIHLLLIPKLHIDSLADIKEEHHSLMAHFMAKIPLIASQQGLNKGFRTIINTGKEGGQEVYHLHAHLLGGGQTVPTL